MRRQTVDTHSALLPWHNLQYTASLTDLGLLHAKDWNCLDVGTAPRAVQPTGIYRMIGCVPAGQSSALPVSWLRSTLSDGRRSQIVIMTAGVMK